MPHIILDRDGVINYDSDLYIKSPEEWRAIPGSLDAIAQLNRCGFSVFVVTNQSGVARGLYDLMMLDRIHEKMLEELATVGGTIDEIFFCPHHPNDQCVCRKPNPGLLYQIQEKHGVPLDNTYFIGDSLCDVRAARAAQCNPMLVLTGNGERHLKLNPELVDVPNFPDLAHAVEFILCQKK